MVKWTITIVPSAMGDIRKIPRGKAADVTDTITALGKESRPFGCEEVEAHPNIYKIRVEEYTVEYELIEDDKIVKILVIS